MTLVAVGDGFCICLTTLSSSGIRREVLAVHKDAHGTRKGWPKSLFPAGQAAFI